MNMQKRALIALSMIAGFGCSDPAEQVPAAATKVATPVAAETPKTAEGLSGETKLETLTFNNEKSTIAFVGSKVTDSHEGEFKEFSGKIELNRADMTKSKVSVDIKLSSVQADHPKLTGHLQAPDFFDVGKFATATFATSKIEKTDKGYNVTGTLDFHGVKKEISFPANIAVTDKDVAAKAEFSINRQDWGVAYPGMKDDLIRDNVVIKLDLKAGN